MTLAEELKAGLVARYHTTPNAVPQNIAAHSWGVMLIILRLHPNPPRALLVAALEHDMPEYVLGDVPAPAKWSNPELGVAYTEAELAVCREHGWSHAQYLAHEYDQQWLKAADMLELIYWCDYCADELGHRGYRVMAERGRAYLSAEWVPIAVKRELFGELTHAE